MISRRSLLRLIGLAPVAVAAPSSTQVDAAAAQAGANAYARKLDLVQDVQAIMRAHCDLKFISSRQFQPHETAYFRATNCRRKRR